MSFFKRWIKKDTGPKICNDARRIYYTAGKNQRVETSVVFVVYFLLIFAGFSFVKCML